MKNTLSRINDTLPPEIISVVFQCVVLRDDSDATDTGPQLSEIFCAKSNGLGL